MLSSLRKEMSSVYLPGQWKGEDWGSLCRITYQRDRESDEGGYDDRWK